MGTPLGEFVRAKRDSIRPEDLGFPAHQRRRAPGLRRSELASRAGVSVEYLTRIEQGRDRNPSRSVVNALADALNLDTAERTHLGYLAKITGGACAGRVPPRPPERTVRPAVRRILALLEPGIAFVTNRLGDVLAHTDGFGTVMRDTGLLDAEEPNLTRYVFTHPQARTTFVDWDQIADEQVFNLWLGPSTETFEWFTADFATVAGAEFTRRLHRHIPPTRVPLRMTHPRAHQLRWNREVLELPASDAQQLILLLPADDATATALDHLRERPHRTALRAV
ncbi:transcriptional regulator with XRE-family HTH domain [Catenuloplanes nepalensis]|uniref:Transcriptional regulator with XRE-family HTH domain n=1 Tax=Catenuloplanes nepalensis TaxID=587533 RepID=A0ABT9MSN0_9ACTN|nr:helix-turn-helix transcriptional regulator [Catenuloplanes nepalensis]MDP9794440.1 transcriptional regulator with XRE-family HTH domain [Catenuloplanes nepalensis]